MQTLTLKRGDSKTVSATVSRDARAWPSVIFTAKTAKTKTDAEAKIQKVLGAGLTVPAADSVSLAFVHADTVELLGSCSLVWDIQGQDATGAVYTIAEGKLLVDADVTQELQTSIPVYTSEPPLPGGGGGAVSSVNGQTGAVVLTKSDVGLGSVDNTADLAKPISTATQAALDGKASVGHTHAWGDITGKPTTFTPAAHTHIVSEVTGLQTALDGKSAVGHTHPISEVTGLQTALDGKSAVGHTHAYSEITGKPSTFAPSAHTHPTSEVTGLDATLAGKSDTSHTHTFASLTSKPTTLAGYGITDALGANSPALTGTPTAPTAASTTDTTQLATTAFVQEARRLSTARNAVPQALVFDGTSNATTTLPAFGTGDFTVALRVKRVPTASANLVMLGAASANCFLLFSDQMNSYRVVAAKAGGPALVTSTNGIPADWVHITYVRGAGVGTIYINGVANGSAADASDYTTASTLLGAYTSTRWRGSIGSLDVYNRALTAAEVSTLFLDGDPDAAEFHQMPTGTPLITGDDSTFASDSGRWVRQTGVTISGGFLTFTNVPQYQGALWINATYLRPGYRYRTTVVVSTLTSGQFYVVGTEVGGTGDKRLSAPGTYTFEFVARTADPYFKISAFDANTSGTIDSVTLVPVGVLLSTDREQHGYGYTLHDVSGTGSHVQLPVSGVSWALPHYPISEVWAIQAVPTDVVFGSKTRDTASFGTGASATSLQSSPPAGLGPTSFSLSVGSSGTGASISGWRGGLGGSVNRFPYTQAQVPVAEWFTAFAIPALSDGTDTFTVRIGLGVQGTGAATLPAGFAGILIEGATVSLCSRNSNVDTLGATTTITANTTVRFRMRFEGGVFSVWINGALLGQMTAPASFYPFPLVQILATAGTASRNVLHGTGAFQFAILNSAL